MPLLPLIQLPGGRGNHLGPIWLFTVMMTYNTRPIHSSVCSKDMAVDPCVSKTKGAAFGIQALLFAASPCLLALIASMCVMLTGGNGIKRDGEDGEKQACRFGKSATSLCLPRRHD